MSIFGHKLTLLGLVQVINLSAPVISTLILIDVFGTESYGKYVYYMAIASLLMTVATFSIQPIALREKAAGNHDENIMNTIIIIQLLFYFFISGILIMLEKGDSAILFGAILTSLSFNLFFPVWRYQIDNNLQTYIIMSVIYKMVPILLIYLGVNLNIEIYPLLQTSVLFCFLLIHINRVKYVLQIKSENLIKSGKVLTEGVSLFVAKMSAHFYVYLPKIVLGSTGGMTGVAIYDIAEKLSKLLKQPVYVISQYVIGESSEGNKFALNLRKITFLGSSLSVLLLILFWSVNVELFDFDNNELRIMFSLSVINFILVMLTTLHCYLQLIINRRDKLWLRVSLIGFILFAILLSIYRLLAMNSPIYMFLLTTTVELVVFVYSFYIVGKNIEK